MVKTLPLHGENIGSIPIFKSSALFIRLWCNGSIRGSNPLGQSSNLWGRAIGKNLGQKNLIILP